MDDGPIGVEARILLYVSSEGVKGLVQALRAVDLPQHELEGLRGWIDVPAEVLQDFASQGANPTAHAFYCALSMSVVAGATSFGRRNAANLPKDEALPFLQTLGRYVLAEERQCNRPAAKLHLWLFRFSCRMSCLLRLLSFRSLLLLVLISHFLHHCLLSFAQPMRVQRRQVGQGGVFSGDGLRCAAFLRSNSRAGGWSWEDFRVVVAAGV